MKKTTAKRILAALCAMAMLGSTVACSSGTGEDVSTGSTEGTSQAEGSSLTPVGEFPFAKGDVTINIGMGKLPFVEDYETNKLTKTWEEKSGVNIDFTLFPDKDGDQKLEVMVASGSALPDVLMMGLSDSSVWNYAKAGKLIKLNDYYENSSYYLKKGIPEANKEIHGDVLKAIRMSDGNLYTTPVVGVSTSNNWPGKAWINTKWLKNVGMEMPKTTEDLYKVLTAFRDKDPNGNGKKDEIPMVGGGGWNQNAWEYLMYSFAFISNTYFSAEDGKLSVPYNTTEWQNGLKYIQKLVDEGLLSPLSFTQDGQQLKAMSDRTEEETIAGLVVAGGNMHAFGPDNENKLNYECLDPLVGPDGVQWTRHQPTLPGHSAAITSDCKNSEAAFRLLDVLWEEEISILARFGEKGADWVEPDADALSGYESIGIPASMKIVNETWITTNNVHYNLGLGYLSAKWQDGLSSENPLDPETRHKAATVKLMGHAPEEVVAKISYTNEELDDIKEIKSTLDTYMRESAVRFVTGDMDIEKDWDGYVQELDKIGLSHYLEVSQTAYERTNQ